MVAATTACPPQPHAIKLPNVRRRDGRHHHPAMLGARRHSSLHVGRRTVGADHRPGGDPTIQRRLNGGQRWQEGLIDPARVIQRGQHRHLLA